MEPNNSQQNSTESSGMALSGLILGIVALICSFFPAWRTIGLVIGLGCILLSALNFAKAKKNGVKTTRSATGLILGILAALVASYFLFVRPAKVQAASVPEELRDTAGRGDPSALDKLKNITDSTNAQKQ